MTSKGVVTLDVEIADTPARQALGLMYRTSLPDRYGMLFIHSPPRESTMWMRNTYIPLDMVFIRADGTIHRIAEMTEPHSEEVIASRGPVSAVLEIAGGAARTLGLKTRRCGPAPAFRDRAWSLKLSAAAEAALTGRPRTGRQGASGRSSAW